ncbi:MAG TPA: hypothetical protein VFB41_06970 [Solirubrobacteraceae bacterium]|nr:hypothetical protein [Solirubrobacteraceae bacterium]
MKRFEDRLLKHLLERAYPARSRRRRRLRRRVVLIAAPIVLLGGVALAKTVVIPTSPGSLEPKNPAAARHVALVNQAYALINKAVLHVNATMPECKPSYRRGPTRPLHGAPSQAVLDVLAPLRRPARPSDRQQTGNRGLEHGTYVDYVRMVTAANGARFTIIVGRRVREIYRPTKQCLDAEHARLVELVEGEPAALRSAALGAFGKMRHGQENNATIPTTPQDQIYLYGSTGGGGGIDVATFRTRGLFSSSGGSFRPGASKRVGRASSTLSGLVPDGVATVTVHYPKIVSNGPYYKPTAYPAAFTQTLRVRDNVISATIPRDAPRALGDARMTWRDAGGAVIRSFRL